MKHLIWESNFMDFIVGNMQKSTHAFALFYQRDNQNHEMVRYAQSWRDESHPATSAVLVSRTMLSPSNILSIQLSLSKGKLIFVT